MTLKKSCCSDFCSKPAFVPKPAQWNFWNFCPQSLNTTFTHLSMQRRVRSTGQVPADESTQPQHIKSTKMPETMENLSKPLNHQDTKTFASFLRQMSVSMAGGLIFGYLFERSHVYEPSNIREQFFFTKFVMLKMFLGAMVGACVSFLVVFKVGGAPNTASVQLDNGDWKTFLDHRTGKPSLFDGVRKPKYGIFRFSHAVRAAIGGSLLGAGMVVSGACPGIPFFSIFFPLL